MRVHCIRHGESTFNVERRIQGQLDVPLSATGRLQGVALASYFADYKIDLIVASPLSRAWKTAEPIARTTKANLIADDRLKELNAGVFQGLLIAELSEKFPAEAALWRSKDPDFCIPEGESRRDLMNRGQAALLSLRDRGFSEVVVVSHGGLLTCAFKALLQIPADRNPFTLYNASISTLEFLDEVHLLTLNSLEHLKFADVPVNEPTSLGE